MSSAARVLAEHIPARRHLGFVAIGESSSGRTAADAEDMLAKDSAADAAGRQGYWTVNSGQPPALYRSIADGEVMVERLSEADWRRIAALTEHYADQHVGGVDAGLIAVAERLDLTTIATLDRRHFGVVRPSRPKVITLIP